MREYAQERLDAVGELAAARRGHAHHYLDLAERAAPALRGRDQRVRHLRLEREHDTCGLRSGCCSTRLDRRARTRQQSGRQHGDCPGLLATSGT
ncbi:MAG TPA: hypothetical protein VKC57_01225 [Ktedonobacterales bacterium]|nr:hypothetical protein [Ktedonobacterales bacterium]